MGEEITTGDVIIGVIAGIGVIVLVGVLIWVVKMVFMEEGKDKDV
ncbi:MAG: hypothetical protein VST66_03255 [Nitrospirota bacterium]|nr:hypothetical protein [Nitrospirota bacterium]